MAKRGEFDSLEAPQLRSGSNIAIVGATQTGKTSLLAKWLRLGKRVFEEAPSSIHWFYQANQPEYERLERDLGSQRIKFHRGTPSRDELEAIGIEGGSSPLVVIDDVSGNEMDAELSKMIRIDSHHHGLTTCLIAHSLFHRNPFVREILKNCHYLILTKNKRDRAAVVTLARQMYPGHVADFMKSYEDATKPKFGYLVIDSHPRSEDRFSLKTRLERQFPTVYDIP